LWSECRAVVPMRQVKCALPALVPKWSCNANRPNNTMPPHPLTLDSVKTQISLSWSLALHW
jgi:hypothetical protein